MLFIILEKFEPIEDHVYSWIYLFERSFFAESNEPEIIRGFLFNAHDVGFSEWFKVELLDRTPDWEKNMAEIYNTLARKIIRAIDEKVMIEIDMDREFHPTRIETMIRVSDIPIKFESEEARTLMLETEDDIKYFLKNAYPSSRINSKAR